ncbi:phenolic acid decarboxylase subunit C [mine drainage metagenome]|uniref:Phenolic acid decarboxylase subunit C n=1 Tax=mine drainage metagenome TaxID=410659 RepID=A0A1J5R5D7_9ZZZZ
MTARASDAEAMGSPMGRIAGEESQREREAQGFKIPYEDLREWIAEAEKLGEIRVVKGATWQEEIGMAAELVQHDEHAPCVIFDEVPGCEKGYRILTNFFGGRRKNFTLGFPLHFTKLELSEAFLEHYMRELKTIPHEYVETGPVMENVLTGDAIDVTKFPVPLWHEGDGGRYIGTGSYNITIDPEEKWINVGTYRVMIHDKNTLGFYMSPGKHGRIHRDKYQARNEPMPVAIVVGGDPLQFLVACSEMPYGVCELDIAGGLRGKAVKVVKGKVTGLPIPANAEMVIEGFVQPGKRKLEGPFGEWTGYYGSDIREEPVLDIKAIYHRNNPIIVGCPPQRPPEEQARYRAVTRSALIRKNIAAAGVPDVTAVWAHEVGGSRMLLGVSIKQRYGGHAKQAGHVAAMCHAGAYAGKYVVVVDDDIDVSNLEELMWALLTRSDPATSIDIITGTWSTPLDPRIPPEQKDRGDNTNSRAIIDACRPFPWRDKFPKVNTPSPELARRTLEKFGYLLK